MVRWVTAFQNYALAAEAAEVHIVTVLTHGCFTCVCLFAVSGLELRSCPGAHAHLFANLGYAFGQA